jgi:uracil-DNA glycosylase
MLVGEGGGRTEAREGKPFVGAAGKVLERAIKMSGLSRDDYTITNLLHCFVSPKTMVFTPHGYDQMYKLQVGDFVLTHKGRFRKIINKVKLLGGTSAIQIEVRVSGLLKTSASRVTVTADHRFFVNDRWIFASDLSVGDRLTCLGEHCIVCQQPFFRGFKTAYRTTPFCSTSCHGKYAMVTGAAKISESMKQQYATGKRDPQEAVKAAHGAIDKLMKGGWKPFSNITDEQKTRRRISAALTRQTLGIQDRFTWIGKGESVAAEILRSAGVEFIPQFAIGSYNYDFKIGNLIVEIDGEGARLNGLRRHIQPVKDKLAEDNGYTVIHLPDNSVKDILSYVQNDEHDYPFIETEILSIRNLYWKKAVYSLQVDEDESYVAQGLVNHNCQPPGNELRGAAYEREALDHCRCFLSDEIAERRPRIILALGEVPLRELSAVGGGQASLRGYCLPSIYPDTHVIGTFHPSRILRGDWNLFGVLLHDLRRAHTYAKNGVPQPMETDYDLAGRDIPSYLHRLNSDPTLAVAYDIETASILGEEEPEDWRYKRIIQIQFSSAAGTAIVLPWPSEAARSILATPNPKLTWNGRLSDDVALKAQGVEIGGESFDAMLMWSHLQPGFGSGRDATNEDKGVPARLLNLQAAISFYYPYETPWKGTVTDAETLKYYGARDADLTFRIGTQLMQTLKAQGLWDGFYRYKHQLGKVLTRMSERGLPIDRERQERLRSHIEAQELQLEAELQTMIPAELKPVKQFKGWPKDLRESVKSAGLYVKRCQPMEFPEIVEALGYRLTETGLVKPLPFNAGSSKQVISYIQHCVDTIGDPWYIPTHIDTKKPSANKAGMEALIDATDDAALRHIEKCKKISKLKDYCGEKWLPEADGCVHAEFRIGATGTGQTTATNPPIQTYPKHLKKEDEWLEPTMRMIKQIIKAPDGYVMIETDMRGFHARMQGFLAEDAAYYRLANLDAHSFSTAHYVGVEDRHQLLELDDAALMKRLKEIKKDYEYERNYMIKRISFLNQYGGGAEKAATILRIHRIQVEAILNMIKDLFKPTFRDLPAKIEQQLRANPRLVSPFGFPRFFWDGDVNQAMAFWVANPAHCVIQDAVMRLAERGALEKYGAVNIMHDALWWCCPVELADECIQVAHEELGRPSEVLVNSLGAFHCAADAKMGPDMDSLRDV